MGRLAVSEKHGVEFWRIGEDVYRAPIGSGVDVYGHPNGKRWEASLAHWLRFRAVFAWAEDV